MADWLRSRISPDTTVRQTVANLNDSQFQVALVVDGEGTLLGVVTDGDVRRAILAGVDLDGPVSAMMNSNPVTISRLTSDLDIINLMQSKQIHQVPIVDEMGRVEDLEILMQVIRRHESRAREDHWVVLMAGGLGMRLRPLTEDTPKPLLPIGGKPLLQTILNNFIAQGFRKFFFSINYKAEMVKEFFGDGSKWGVEIRYIEEDTRMGTAGALSLLPEALTKPVIVMNGDLLTLVNFHNLIQFHNEHEALATMCVREYAFQVPFGVADLDGHKLTGLSEKPVQQFFVNAGIYVLSPELIARMPKGQPCDMPDLFDGVIKGGEEAVVFPVHEYWLDIGRFDDLERAQKEFPEKFGE